VPSTKFTADDIEWKLRGELGLNGSQSVLAFASMASLGPDAPPPTDVLHAIRSAVNTLVMPAFTYQTLIIPQTGPPDNAIVYGSGDSINAKAEFFRPDMPVHPDCGPVAEELRKAAGTLRSVHPILSFVANGQHAREVLSAQTRQNPLGPLAWLEAKGGFVLLMGMDQRENYALHLAEQRAGRPAFTRWALTANDIEAMPNIPGCMEGFNSIWAEMINFTRVTGIGSARVELIPLRDMLSYAEERLRSDPNFMLCDKPSCLSCRAREV
jgi:aminoglycoside 3-N-acetyltransferase